MSLHRIIALSLLPLTGPPAPAQGPEAEKQRLDEAERRIVRLQPSAFHELPGNISRELERRGCTIPQTGYAKKPHNVIRGEFSTLGQPDWAVLCSVKSVGWILIFWNGSDKNPAVIAGATDRGFFDLSRKDFVYTRAIWTAGVDFIRRHNPAAPTATPILHQGIEEAFIGKSSVVHYFDRATGWTTLHGADLRSSEGPQSYPPRGFKRTQPTKAIAPALIFKTDAQYTAQAAKAGLEGSAYFRLMVDHTGVPRRIRFITFLVGAQRIRNPLGLDRTAMAALRQWRFRPGLKDGKPTSVEATAEVLFRLPR